MASMYAFLHMVKLDLEKLTPWQVNASFKFILILLSQVFLESIICQLRKFYLGLIKYSDLFLVSFLANSWVMCTYFCIIETNSGYLNFC